MSRVHTEKGMFPRVIDIVMEEVVENEVKHCECNIDIDHINKQVQSILDEVVQKAVGD